MRVPLSYLHQHERYNGADDREHDDLHELALEVEAVVFHALAADDFGIEVLEDVQPGQQNVVENDHVKDLVAFKQNQVPDEDLPESPSPRHGIVSSVDEYGYDAG